MEGLQAAILNVKLKRPEEWTGRRRTVAAKYDQMLTDVVRPASATDVRHMYHTYTWFRRATCSLQIVRILSQRDGHLCHSAAAEDT
jgi:dTDP-4-amino-4,6-dideoxygalactose transaminase